MRTTTVLIGTALLTLGIAAGAEAQRPAPRAQPRVQPRAERVAVARGWLGILFREADGDEETMVVGNVMRDSPAARAGLQVGDTVTLWNGRRDVETAMRERALEPGDTVRVRVRRGGAQRELTIVAGNRPQTVVFSGQSPEGEDLYIIRPREIERQMRVFSDSLMVRADSLHQKLQLMLRDSLGARLREFEFKELPQLQAQLRAMEFPEFGRDGFVFELGTRSVAGAEFAEMNEGLAPHFGTDEGVLVLKVAAETPAARAGLQAGDVVVRVNDQPVSEIAELRRAVARAQTRAPRTVTLQVVRRGQRTDLQMRWE
jgi:S1-C subfamily serine protease